jgi:hypothetical protein
MEEQVPGVWCMFCKTSLDRVIVICVVKEQSATWGSGSLVQQTLKVLTTTLSLHCQSEWKNETSRAKETFPQQSKVR